MSDRFRLPHSAEMVRARPLRRLVEPWLERRHLYDRYTTFLDRLASERFLVVPLREFRVAAPGARALVGLRHDVDARLDAALELARLEYERGIRSTYFILHSAPYYDSDVLLPRLLQLEQLGHEVGFHYDLVTTQVVEGHDPRAVLGAELERLRGAGLDIVGAAAHGSYWGHKLGYRNDYFFLDLDEPAPEFPNAARVSGIELEKGTLEEYGFAYDASRLDESHYWTDSRLDDRGRRWHPELLDLEALGSGDRAIVLVHPDHWDRSLGVKYLRTFSRLGRRALRGRS